MAAGEDFEEWFWVALLLTTVFGALNLFLLAQLTGTPMSLWSIPSSLAWSSLLLLMTWIIELSDLGPVESGRQLQEPVVVVIAAFLSSAGAGLLILFHFIPNWSRSRIFGAVLVTPLIWGVILPLAGYLGLALFYISATPLAYGFGGIWTGLLLIGLIWYAMGLIHTKVYSLLSLKRGME